MKTLIFHRDKVAELHISLKGAQIPPSIRESLSELENIRFSYRGLDYAEVNERSEEEIAQSPLFFEWQRVDLFFEASALSSFQPPYRLLINELESKLASTKIGKNHKLTGSFSLEQAVGYTDLKILDGRGRPVFVLETEVFPQKLNYKEDFHDMISDISDILYNLAFDYLKKTYGFTIPRQAYHQSLTEWLAILKVLFDSLERSIDLIRKNPSSKVCSDDKLKPVGQLRRADHSSVKWIRKNPRYLTKSHESTGIILAQGISISQLPDQRKYLSYDTHANRFVKWAIRQIIQRLDEIGSLLKRLNSKRTTRELESLSNYKRRLSSRLRDVVFSDLQPFDQLRQFSTVVSMAPGYRDFYHRFLMLQKGLYLHEHDVFRLDYKHTATLYEYWCFLKLVKTLQQQPAYKLSTQDLIQVEHNRLRFRLQKGKASCIRFKNDKGDRIELSYNRKFSSDTFTQIPDNLLEFYKAGYREPFRMILDAKYRFDQGNAHYPGSTVKHGPPLDAIAQLHRYRDAILFSDKYKTSIQTSASKAFGGVILFPFPGPESHFTLHPFFKSIQEVNIGAIPLQVGRNKPNRLFKEFLNYMFEASPEMLFEQVIDYEKSEYNHLLKQLNTPVLIASIPPKERQAFLRLYFEERIFFIPLTLLTGQSMKDIRYLALFDQKNRMLIAYAEVLEIDFMIGKELEVYGLNSGQNRKYDKYILFRLEQGTACGLQLSSYHPAHDSYVNLFSLLQSIEKRDENYLFLQSYEELKLWRQLIRIDASLSLAHHAQLMGTGRGVVFNFRFKAYDLICYLLDKEKIVFSKENEELSIACSPRENIVLFLDKNVEKLTY